MPDPKARHDGVDNEQLKQVVAGAVLTALSPEARESLIAEAVKGLLIASERSNYSGERTSPLQDAFKWACQKIAQEQCEVEMRKPENMAKIVAIVSAGIATALDGQAKAISDNLGDVIVKALSGQLKERYLGLRPPGSRTSREAGSAGTDQ